MTIEIEETELTYLYDIIRRFASHSSGTMRTTLILERLLGLPAFSYIAWVHDDDLASQYRTMFAELLTELGF